MQNAFAVTGAGKQGPTGVFAKDVAIGQAELADRAFDEGGQALGGRAKEFLAAVDQVFAGIAVAQRTLGEGGRHGRGHGGHEGNE
ncbi:hypothetical protein D9M68_783250 [compost metagenome]